MSELFFIKQKRNKKENRFPSAANRSKDHRASPQASTAMCGFTLAVTKLIADFDLHCHVRSTQKTGLKYMVSVFSSGAAAVALAVLRHHENP